MSCVHPIPAWRNNYSDLRSRKRAAPFFKPPPKISLQNNTVKYTPLPCGRCICCRIDQSRQWALRGVCETNSVERSSFLTLTYKPESLPPTGSLVKQHYQDFIRALRRRGYKFTFMLCGEYGKNLGRPHYHMICFGEDFKQNSTPAPIPQTEQYPLYINQQITDLWSHGHVVIGSVTFSSIQYVAKYVTKKVTGEMAKDHYDGKHPEFMQPSTRPAIGKRWFDRYETDVYPSDQFVFEGKVLRPPKYFQRRYAQKYPDKALDLSVKRETVAGLRNHLNTPERLQARKAITLARFVQHIRKLEESL